MQWRAAIGLYNAGHTSTASVHITASRQRQRKLSVSKSGMNLHSKISSGSDKLHANRKPHFQIPSCAPGSTLSKEFLIPRLLANLDVSVWASVIACLIVMVAVIQILNVSESTACIGLQMPSRHFFQQVIIYSRLQDVTSFIECESVKRIEKSICCSKSLSIASGFHQIHWERNSLCLANIRQLLLLRAGDVEQNPGPKTPTIWDIFQIPFTEAKWYELGQVLGLQTPTLTLIIAGDYSNLTQRKKAMFRAWLKETSYPSWVAVVDALRKIGEMGVANEMDRKHIQSAEDTGAPSTTPRPPLTAVVARPRLQSQPVLTEDTRRRFVDKRASLPTRMSLLPNSDKPSILPATPSISLGDFPRSHPGTIPNVQVETVQPDSGTEAQRLLPMAPNILSSPMLQEQNKSSHTSFQQGIHTEVRVVSTSQASRKARPNVPETGLPALTSDSSPRVKASSLAPPRGASPDSSGSSMYHSAEPERVDSGFLTITESFREAVFQGNKEHVAMLLKHNKVNIDMDLKDGATALHVAAAQGHYEVVLTLVRAFANVNPPAQVCSPILFEPARNGHSLILECLLRNGARPNERDQDGMTALIVAASSCKPESVVVLLQYGADPEAQCYTSPMTALSEAIENDSLDSVSLLMKALKKKKEKSDQLFKVKTAEGVGKLVDEGVRVDERRGDGVTPLMMAAKDGNVEVAQQLLEHQANVDLQDDDDCTALMYASREGHVNLVKLLVDRQAILDLKSRARGWTALMFAASEGHVQVVSNLLVYGSNPNVLDRNKNKANDIAEGKGHFQIVSLLMNPSKNPEDNDSFVVQLGSVLSSERTKETMICYTDEEVNCTLQEDAVTVNKLQLGLAGLPLSGKTTLYNSLIDKLDESTVVIEKRLSVSDLVILESEKIKKPKWITAGKMRHEVLVMAVALAQINAKKKGILQVQLTPEHVPTMFRDSELLRTHWKEVIKSFHQFTSLVNDLQPSVLSDASLTFLTLWDIGTNFELMKVLAGRCQNKLMLNLLSLNMYSTEEQLHSHMHVKDERIHSEKYTPLRCLSANVSVGFWRFKDAQKVVLVGTHNDQLSREEVVQAKRRVLLGTEQLLQEEDLGSVVSPVMLAINPRKSHDVVKVKETVEQLIKKNASEFKKEIPLRWLFLRGVLTSSGEVYMSRKELSDLSKKCGLHGEPELEEWLLFYQSSTSIVYSPTTDMPTLHNYIVINVPVFLKHLNKLYSVFKDCSDKFPDLKDHITETKFGFLSHELAERCLNDRENFDFYMNVLKDLGVVTELGANGITAGELVEGKLPTSCSQRWYFMPSIRQAHKVCQPCPKDISDMLRISLSNGAAIALYRQAQVVNHLITLFVNEEYLLSKDRHYFLCKEKHSNVLRFMLCFPMQVHVEVSVYFCATSIYIHVKQEERQPTTEEEQIASVVAFVKSTSIKVLKSILQHISDLSYNFSIVCPNSDLSASTPRKCHYIEMQSAKDGHIYCIKCHKYIELESFQGLAKTWIADQLQSEDRLLPVTPYIKDSLTPGVLSNICKLIVSTLPFESCTRLLLAIGYSEAELNSKYSFDKVSCVKGNLQHVVYLVLSDWQSRSPLHGRLKLARAVIAVGYLNVAVKVYPHIIDHRSIHTDLVVSDAMLSALTQHIQDWASLGLQLGLSGGELEAIAQSGQKQSTCCFEALKMDLSKAGDGGGDSRWLAAVLVKSRPRLTECVRISDTSMLAK